MSSLVRLNIKLHNSVLPVYELLLSNAYNKSIVLSHKRSNQLLNNEKKKIMFSSLSIRQMQKQMKEHQL